MAEKRVTLRLDEVFITLSEDLRRSQEDVKISVAKIEEHLRAINGSLQRHENDINIIEKDIEDSKIKITKLMVIYMFASSIIGAILTNGILRMLRWMN